MANTAILEAAQVRAARSKKLVGVAKKLGYNSTKLVEMLTEVALLNLTLTPDFDTLDFNALGLRIQGILGEPATGSVQVEEVHEERAEPPAPAADLIDLTGPELSLPPARDPFEGLQNFVPQQKTRILPQKEEAPPRAPAPMAAASGSTADPAPEKKTPLPTPQRPAAELKPGYDDSSDPGAEDHVWHDLE
jgi:hypothetical protein